MKKYIKSENGYSLVTVMLIFMLITALGLTLVSVTVGSSKFVAFDRVSAEDRVNAENRMEEAMGHIENEVEKINGEALNASNALSKMDSAIASVRNKGKNKYTLSEKTLRYGDNGVFMKKVTIETPLGTSGKKLSRTIIISTIAEVFQYGSVSPGNMILNGASYIEGDVFVKGNLSTQKFGKYTGGGYTYWPETSYPAINGYLTVKGKYYKANKSSTMAENFSPTPTNLSKYFSVTPKLRDRQLETSTLNYSKFKNEINLTLGTENRIPACSSNKGKLVCPEGNSDYNSKISFPSGMTFAGDLTIGKNADVTVNGNLVVEGKLTINPGGKLTVKDSVRVNQTATFGCPIKRDWFGNIIDDNCNEPISKLTLGSDSSFIYIEKSTTIRKLDFTGKMFIDDQVIIRDDMNTNGTVFVKDDVDVQNLSNTNGGTLVIIADGQIKLANNNEYNDNPKVIDAYFYSNKQLEIYGVGSHIQIKGGIYGNPIILNATKGRTKSSSFTGSEREGTLYFQTKQDSIDPSKSRLSIIYKKELILNPPTGIPTVDKVQIKELDSSFE